MKAKTPPYSSSRSQAKSPPYTNRRSTAEERRTMAKSKPAARKPKAKGAAKNQDWRKKNRVAFDKECLMFRINKETDKKADPIWDYSIHEKELEEREPRKEVLMRTAKRLNDENVKTYADFIHFRTDCIVRDSDGQYGTPESVKLSIEKAKEVVQETISGLASLGFKAPSSWSEKLLVRQRGPKAKRVSKRTKEKIAKLEQLDFLTRI